jgi:hydroxypyruvate reductase/glycerate 2-kinase
VSTGAREEAAAIWRAGVAAVHPSVAVPRALDRLRAASSPFVDFAAHERILVLGAGKAGAAMAEALEVWLENAGAPMGRVSGLVSVPEGTERPLARIGLRAARPAGVNAPTDAAVAVTREILERARAAGPRDLAICLIGGGGSALLCAPAPGITLADKLAATASLVRAAAPIEELNTVRKHLSSVKGGGLAAAFRGRRMLALLISDVIGDAIDVIGSGPTAADPTRFADALDVIERRGVRGAMPPAAVAHLERGARSEAPETLKSPALDTHGEPLVHHEIVASNRLALDAAAREAARRGHNVVNLGGEGAGETVEAAAELAATVAQMRARGARHACIVSGGETTVTLPLDAGLGGRNQEFALAFARALGRDGARGATLLAAGTDGEDGPTDAAGAFADSALLDALDRAAIDDALARHDTYPLLARGGALFKPGPTGTNVMDLRVVLLDET